MDAELVKALVPAAFSFAAAVAGLLWSEQSKRAEAQRLHSHQANMLRRVLVADLEIVRKTMRGNALIANEKDKSDVSVGLPYIRTYDVEKLGLLTVTEIDPVLTAIAIISNQREIIRAMAKKQKPIDELQTLALADAVDCLDNFRWVADTCGRAIDALKAEIGPVE